MAPKHMLRVLVLKGKWGTPALSGVFFNTIPCKNRIQYLGNKKLGTPRSRPTTPLHSGVPGNFRQGVRIQAFTKLLLVADPGRANPVMDFGLPPMKKKFIVVYMSPIF